MRLSCPWITALALVIGLQDIASNFDAVLAGRARFEGSPHKSLLTDRTAITFLLRAKLEDREPVCATLSITCVENERPDASLSADRAIGDRPYFWAAPFLREV